MKELRDLTELTIHHVRLAAGGAEGEEAEEEEFQPDRKHPRQRENLYWTYDVGP